MASEGGSLVEGVLAHYGVKGMRWGKHKQKAPASADSTQATTLKKKAKSSGVKSLSNAEIQTAINRMNLEQQYKRLKTNEAPAVKRLLASALLEVGTREVKNLAGAKISAAIKKKTG